jgi:hypothetical protein
VAVGEADRRPDPAGRLRLPAEKVTEREKQLIADPKEQEVIADLQEAAADDFDAKLKDVPRRAGRRQGAAEPRRSPT